jgi:general secretion pathway protein C
MLARWWTLMTWALVAAAALFWGLRVFVRAPPVPPGTPVATIGPAARGDLTRLLGNDPPPPVVAAVAEAPPDARFQLIGVVTPRATAAAREGLALIAVDGKPAKAYRVGAVIDGQTILKSVAARGAMLGPRDGAAQVTLSLAPPAAANTGALPSLAPSAAGGNANPGFAAPPAAEPPAGPAAVSAARARGVEQRGMRRMLPPPALPVDGAGQPTQ